MRFLQQEGTAEGDVALDLSSGAYVLCVQTGNIFCWSLELQFNTEIVPERCNYTGEEVQFCLSEEVY